MLPERWKLARSILEHVLELPESEREPFIVKSCAGDDPLEGEVRTLLRREHRDALHDPSRASLELAQQTSIELGEAGVRIGPFRLEARIAVGGMGEVWRARRVEGFAQVEGREQAVAIKLIKLGMDTEEMLRRFANERALLAGLQHDGIARLIDGGADERGRPYLVMEFVDGTAIDRYCNEHALSIRERIALFLSVCDAVQFAHERLVVHRDLKPSNILVTRDGRPKLLDFGIAKVLSADGDEFTSEHTLPGQRVMTPAYASPEQLGGERLTAKSDVYSLGVALWELCAGQRAFASERTPESELPRASTVIAQRTGSRRLAREIAGDLDTILATACHVEPARRYGSVEALASDLRRFLAFQPVHARGDSVVYRISKFTRRNRLLVGSLTTVFLALLGATIVSSRMYVRAADARDRAAEARDKELEQSKLARERFDQTRELATKFLFEVHDSIKDLPGATTVRERLLTTAADTLDRLSSAGSSSRDLDADLFDAYLRLAKTRCDAGAASLGRGADALRTLDKAQSIAERLEAPDADRARRLAQVEYLRGGVFFFQTQYESAEHHYRACFDLLSDPRLGVLDASTRRIRGDAIARLAYVARLRSRFDEASCWLDALSESRAAQTEATLADRLNDQVVIAHERSQLLDALGEQDAALELRRTALAWMEQLAAMNPESAALNLRIAMISFTLATALMDHGRMEEAEAAAERACTVGRELVLADPSDQSSASQLRNSLCTLGRTQLALERWPAARDTFDEMAGLAELRRAAEPQTWAPASQLALARTMQAVAVMSDGDVSRGLELSEEASAIIRAALALAPVGSRVSAPSFEVQLAETLVEALVDPEKHVDAALSRRARELSARLLLDADEQLKAFEPTTKEASNHRMLLQLVVKTRARLDELAETDRH